MNLQKSLVAKVGVPVLILVLSFNEEKKSVDTYERPKDPKLFDMLVIVGLVFNALIVIFILLFWMDLL